LRKGRSLVANLIFRRCLFPRSSADNPLQIEDRRSGSRIDTPEDAEIRARDGKAANRKRANLHLQLHSRSSRRSQRTIPKEYRYHQEISLLSQSSTRSPTRAYRFSFLLSRNRPNKVRRRVAFGRFTMARGTKSASVAASRSPTDPTSSPFASPPSLPQEVHARSCISGRDASVPLQVVNETDLSPVLDALSAPLSRARSLSSPSLFLSLRITTSGRARGSGGKERDALRALGSLLDSAGNGGEGGGS